VEKKIALQQFFAAAKKLKELEVIRSDKYLGDIAEFICVEKLGIELCNSQRNEGYDGWLNGKRCEVKYNGATRTNVELGDPSKYEVVFVVIGYESCLARNYEFGTFKVYQFTSQEVVANFLQESGKYSCGITVFDEREPVAVYNYATE
jgi:hypothetical protein